jgi:hypothetical protein
MLRWIALGLFVAQTAPPAPAQQAVPAAPQRVFASDVGLVLNFIKPDKTKDFEETIEKLKEALEQSPKPERQQQAASWRVFKASEAAAGGNILYVFLIDPPVKGADYAVATILGEAFPDEAKTLYKVYSDSYGAGQNIVNLKLISELGK